MSDVLNSPSGGCGSGNCACKSQAQQRASRSFLDDTDYGTPARHADVDVTLEIDGQAVTVPAGTSVMRAAAEAGVNVPKLCATDSLEPFGSCRLCLVEIEGRRGYPASCTTPVEAGMKVRTQTDRLQSLRRNVMELYISDHPLDCLTCPANGDCELQDMAGVTGLREVRYGFDGANHLKDKKDESNPYFTYDPSKCIVCNRCVRACEETQGTFALTIAARGFESRVARAFGHHHLCVLRRRLLVQGGDEGQPGGADGAVQERSGQRRSRVREGPLRVGLCDA
jgi:formate dehydrogenase major subunit